MRNMGRLFQYNRFGANDQNAQDNKKDTQNHRIHNCLQNKESQQQFDANCPLAYAGLYPDCTCQSIETTATPRTANTTDVGAIATTTTTATTMTSISIDMALRKYQQWSSKFLPTTANSNTMPVPTTTTTQQITTNTDCVTHLSTSSSQKSNSCSYSTNPSTATSGYYSRQTMIGGNVPAAELEEHRQHWNVDRDRELLVSASKRPKVYDCMKDFLRRKLFHQRHGQHEEQEQAQMRRAQLEATLCKSDTEEDVTSDYDEVDMLDSSYNADEEDASDCSSQCTFPLESDIEDGDQTMQQNSPIEQQQEPHNNNHTNAPQKSISPQKSMLSLNCWQNITHYTDSTTEAEDAEDHRMVNETASELQAPHIFDYQNVNDDSDDAGISDCCQLISEKSNPTKQRKRPQKHKQKSKPPRARYNRQSHGEHGGEEAELLASNWYQPRITTKAALEHLQQATPGTFLLRRKSRTYELCLRAETKVKHFIVVALADNHYKLKGAKKEFTSLKALVTHHSVMAEQLPLTLTLPREYNNYKGNLNAPNNTKCAKSLAFEVSARALRSLRYADDFDTYESLQILGLLQDWQCEAN